MNTETRKYFVTFVVSVFINVLIVRLRESGDGCIVNNQYVGCIVYADDIILSYTIRGLQHMLNTCYEIAANLKLVFNCNKSKCITFGPGCKLDYMICILQTLLIFAVNMVTLWCDVKFVCIENLWTVLDVCVILNK